MKGIIVFDSYFGNTKSVAEAIAQQVIAEGHEAQLVNLRETLETNVVGDFLFIGSPTRIAKMTRRAKKFVKKLDESTWGDNPVAVFDTHMAVVLNEDGTEKNRKWIYPGAAGLMHAMLKERGFNVPRQPLRCLVKGTKGPLAEGELNKAKAYAHEITSILKK